MKLHIRVSAKVVSLEEHPKKRFLLYKHGDDLRQELLAIQFIERCRQILTASGLDLQLKTFRCLPVGAQKGFIEWVSGSVPLSELCQTSCSSFPGSNTTSRQSSWSNEGGTNDDTPDSSPAPIEVLNQAGVLQSQRRSWCKYQSLRGLRQKCNDSIIENPIQDFLRSAAYDKLAPYFVRKDVMDAYVKSCAGYCVITYLLVSMAHMNCFMAKSLQTLPTLFSTSFTMIYRVWVIAILTTSCSIKMATYYIVIIRSF